MRRRHFVTSALVMMTSLAACASAPVQGSADDIGYAGRNSNVISLPEMRSSGATDAYQAISRLRPLFLHRGRDKTPARPNMSSLQVYLDDARLGGLESLQTVPIESIRSIRYLSASEATIRWGTNHMGGVILLSTR